MKFLIRFFVPLWIIRMRYPEAGWYAFVTRSTMLYDAKSVMGPERSQKAFRFLLGVARNASGNMGVTLEFCFTKPVIAKDEE